jgi:phosphoglycerate dehydrogenase-like enzyme
MSDPCIVASGPVPDLVARLLAPFARLRVAPDPSENTLLRMMPDAIGIVLRADARASRRLLDAAPNLRVIGRSGVGVDNVDLEAATERGIPVVFTPGAGSLAVAEGAISLLVSLAKRLPELDRATRAGNWAARSAARILDLDGSTLGLVGLGRIGRETARLARGLGMNIAAFDPLLTPQQIASAGAVAMELEALLAASDFVSLHAPLNDSTRGMMDRRRLALMKPGSFLVNVARGGLFDSLDAVLHALDAGPLDGLGLDVYPQEPPDVSHPLFSHPKVILTPHAMGASVGAVERVFRQMSLGMVEVLSGTVPSEVANPAVLPAMIKG